jgi:uncharacterized protein VirK/YbjX
MGEIQGQPFQNSVNFPLEISPQDSRATPNDGQILVRKLDRRLGFIRWLFVLARQKNSWSPVLIAGELWRLLSNIDKHRKIISLFKLPPYAELFQSNPGFAFRYLTPTYLARGFKGAECASCFLHHYRRLHAALPESVLRQILQSNVTVHEIVEVGNHFAFTLSLPDSIDDKEGELSLALLVDSKKVFNLSFIIVPGWVTKSEAAEVLLITHLQGIRGCNAQIKIARKALHDYSPRGLLIAALQGIGNAFGIGEIGAVCATKQNSYEKACPAILVRGYDYFFANLGMVRNAAGFYSSPIPIEGKPLASISSRKQSQTRARRAMRWQIQSACASFFLRAAD